MKYLAEPIQVEINGTISQCYVNNNQGHSVLKLIMGDNTAAWGLNINLVECRDYEDFGSVELGSAAFNVTNSLLIPTNLASINSVLC